MNAPTTPAAPLAPPHTVEVVLESPIMRGEQAITALTVRKPVAGELRGIALGDLLRGDVTALHAVLPRITSPALTAHDVAQLDLVDLGNLAAEVMGFFMPRAARADLYPSG